MKYDCFELRDVTLNTKGGLISVNLAIRPFARARIMIHVLVVINIRGIVGTFFPDAVAMSAESSGVPPVATRVVVS